MIKSIELKNIQSHKESTLELSPGINCIVGSSNNGKTTIIRALNWVRYNRPLGIDTLASHWIMNDKGHLTDSLSVTIKNENGTVTRKRSKNENQYIVNGKELNVVKSDVPEEVEKTLKLTETNIQNQQDAPFLLSSSSGKVAEYFNKIVKLDAIDKVLTRTETKRRKLNQDIESTENNIKEIQNKLKNYTWLDNVNKLILKYERVQARNEELKNEIEKLSESINVYEFTINKKYDFTVQDKLISKISNVKIKNGNLALETSRIENYINQINSLKNYPDFNEQKKIINNILNVDLSDVLDNKNKVEDSIDLFDLCTKEIRVCTEQIEELKNKLPSICPVCNQPFNFCKEI